MNLLPFNLASIMQIEGANVNPELEFNCCGQIVCKCGCKRFRIFREKYVLTEQEQERRRQIEKIKTKYKEIFDEKDTRLTSGYEKGKEIIGYYRNGKFYHLETIDYPDTPAIPCVVTAKCADCGKVYIVFDSSKNGYDALTSGIPYANNYRLRQKKCRNCGELFEITVNIHNTGRKDLIAEGAGIITEENWTNAFDWITIDLKCAICGKVFKRWFEYETM